MSVYAKEADKLVVLKSLLMTRLAMGRVTARDYSATHASIKKIDARMVELRQLIEAE